MSFVLTRFAFLFHVSSLPDHCDGDLRSFGHLLTTPWQLLTRPLYVASPHSLFVLFTTPW
jgi:hypothetical protein